MEEKGGSMKNFIYFSDQTDLKFSDDTLIADIPQCNSKLDLLDYLSESLNFPEYFGRNLDALWDCIITLEDIETKNIAIIHTAPLNIPDDIFEIYVTMMAEAINIWNLEILHQPPFTTDYGPEHYLDVAFHESLESRITGILSKNEQSMLNSIDNFKKNLESHKDYYERTHKK